MQVILLEKVHNLGNLGDLVRVKDGFARNYLIPKKLARRATEKALKEFEERRAELEKLAAEKLSAAQQLAEKLSGLRIDLVQKAGVDGRLFGSVTAHDIVNAIQAKGFAVEKHQVRMPSIIKTIGEYEVGLHLYVDVDVMVIVNVQPQV